MGPWVLLKLLVKNRVSRKRTGQSTPKFQKVIRGSQSEKKCKKVSKNSSKSTKNHQKVHPAKRAREIHNGTGNQSRSTTTNQTSNGKQFNRCQATAEVNTKT
ncbi:hypothetical protein AVEN_24477-1 [Araneus ventricosus]|uniref:Uncharacterized protein n=1 Tax=Araneus ventricosus TaxID=182803 RepID=A0A4Y2V8W1_ARAVE|nr:hypothetical protein AVEN_24477-1 [Araneus ventricosus]